MNARRWLSLGISVMCAAQLLGQQPPVFRSDASAVAVHVSVKKGNTPVLGLTAGDFHLYDNDVLQDVAAIGLDAVPVDVSIVVATSGIAFLDSEGIRKGIQRISGFLQASDRVRVLTSGNSVVSTVPWRNGRMSDMPAIAVGGGQIRLVADSVLMALLHRTPPDRRHLVVVLTDGRDMCSVVPSESLRTGAERSGAVLHWIKFPDRVSVQDLEGLKMPTFPGVHSYCRWGGDSSVDMRPSLSDAVRLTGGSEYATRLGEAAASAGAFERILDDFKRSYILHYVPRGVSRSGWHRLRVEMNSRGYTVRARPGYWGASATPPP